MGFFIVAFLSFCYISFFLKTTNAATFDITAYGAKGDGNTDDAKAFIQAWKDLCQDKSDNPTLIIPSAKTFLTSCLSFQGPCNSPAVHIELLGNITAPKTIAGWNGCDKNGYLIVFEYVQGLTIDGPGQIDGQGSIWWPPSYELNAPICNCPSMLRIQSCNGLRVSGITHINSPKSHLSITNCQGVELGNLHISAPGNSPNTDGIDISWSSHVNIHDSTIQCGDDCVAINGGTYDINITRVLCGPGHGISIGSLGKDHHYSTVEQVNVRDCNITGTSNGLRIKTVPYGKGYARGIQFQNINLVNVSNPIIIDQHYCIHNMENADCSSPPTASAVRVSDVTYTNIYGSSATQQAIMFNCSEKFKCGGIMTNQVGITGQDIFASCTNARGRFIATTPSVTCN